MEPGSVRADRDAVMIILSPGPHVDQFNIQIIIIQKSKKLSDNDHANLFH